MDAEAILQQIYRPALETSEWDPLVLQQSIHEQVAEPSLSDYLAGLDELSVSFAGMEWIFSNPTPFDEQFLLAIIRRAELDERELAARLEESFSLEDAKGFLGRFSPPVQGTITELIVRFADIFSPDIVQVAQKLNEIKPETPEGLEGAQIEEFHQRSIPSNYEELIAQQRFWSAQTPLSIHFISKCLANTAFQGTLLPGEEEGCIADERDLRPTSDIIKDFQEGRLTDFGKTVRELVQGEDFVDLACGLPSTSELPLILARTFAAQRFIGVDNYAVRTAMSEDTIPVIYCQEDILMFVAQLPDEWGGIFHLSGLEPIQVEGGKKDKHQDEYFDTLMKELSRVCKPSSSGLLIGLGTLGHVNPIAYGFSQVSGDQSAAIFRRA